MNRTIALGVALFVLHLTSYAQEKTTDMKSLMEQAKLSCKLTTPELQERKRTVISELKKQILEKKETQRGMSYKFNGSDEILDKLNEFIKTERLCCDFFTFHLTVAKESESVWLELSGPEGVKEFIKYEIDL